MKTLIKPNNKGGGLVKKKTLIIITITIILALAGISLGTSILVKTNNNEAFQDKEFYRTLGNYLVKQENYEGAVAAYETGLMLGEDENMRSNLAVIYYQQGKYKEAEEHLRKLIMISPENPQYHYDLAINLVDKFRKTEDKKIDYLKEALEEYELTNKISPGYAYSQQNIEVLRNVLQIEKKE